MEFYNGFTHVWHNSNTWSNNLIETVFSSNILVNNIGTNLQFVRGAKTLVWDLFFDKSNTFILISATVILLRVKHSSGELIILVIQKSTVGLSF